MSELFEAWGRAVATLFKGVSDPLFIGDRCISEKKITPFYRFTCPVHGCFEDYWHGYSGFGSDGHLYTKWTLEGWLWVDCPECIKERHPERVDGLGFYAAYAEEEEHHRPNTLRRNEGS